MEWSAVRNKVQKVEGLLAEAEAKCLYLLAKNCGGTIVEIGSYKGKLTVCLASGSKAGSKGKVYAIDPHKGLQDSYARIHSSERTEPIFKQNMKEAGVDDIVAPLVMKSEEAADGWTEPISLLWIDGARDYENVSKDFLLWEPHLKEGGFIAFHDAVYDFGSNYPGIRKVVYANIIKSPRFSDVRFCRSMIYATKITKPSIQNKFLKSQGLLLYYVLPALLSVGTLMVYILDKARLHAITKLIRDKYKG